MLTDNKEIRLACKSVRLNSVQLTSSPTSNPAPADNFSTHGRQMSYTLSLFYSRFFLPYNSFGRFLLIKVLPNRCRWDLKDPDENLTRIYFSHDQKFREERLFLNFGNQDLNPNASEYIVRPLNRCNIGNKVLHALRTVGE